MRNKDSSLPGGLSSKLLESNTEVFLSAATQGAVVSLPDFWEGGKADSSMVVTCDLFLTIHG